MFVRRLILIMWLFAVLSLVLADQYLTTLPAEHFFEAALQVLESDGIQFACANPNELHYRKGYLPTGGDIGEPALVSTAEAKFSCSRSKECRGVTFSGPVAESVEPVPFFLSFLVEALLVQKTGKSFSDLLFKTDKKLNTLLS